MDWILARLKEPSTWIGLISFISGVVCYFTPDNIDLIVKDLELKIIGVINACIGLFTVIRKEKTS